MEMLCPECGQAFRAGVDMLGVALLFPLAKHDWQCDRDMQSDMACAQDPTQFSEDGCFFTAVMGGDGCWPAGAEGTSLKTH